MATYPFIEARNYTRSSGRKVDLLVIHDAEFPERLDGAEAVARYFASTTRDASAHYCVDADSIVQCVHERDVAWAAPGANHNGIQVELTGYARQTRAEWLDAYGKEMLRRFAVLAADIMTRHNLPLRFLDSAALIDGRRGLTTHVAVSNAWHRSTHTDPGPGFPQDYLADLIREELGAQANPGGDEPMKGPPPLLKLGDAGWRVKQAQRLLDGPGKQKIKPTGVFNKATQKAVRAFQRQQKLPETGVIGGATWKALWRVWADQG